jgi:hypothetical protein
VRSRDDFAAAGFNVAIVGRPTDREDLDMSFRAGPEHVEDLRRVARKLKSDYGVPVWLVGTSRGTISAAAAAIGFEKDLIAGIVLTSSITAPTRVNPVTVQTLALDKVEVPVLVMHHRLDACRSCEPRRAGEIVDALRKAPVKKLLLVEGGGGERGDPCEAMHWHGYIGMEREAVDAIVGWIRDPQPERSVIKPS